MTHRGSRIRPPSPLPLTWGLPRLPSTWRRCGAFASNWASAPLAAPAPLSISQEFGCRTWVWLVMHIHIHPHGGIGLLFKEVRATGGGVLCRGVRHFGLFGLKKLGEIRSCNQPHYLFNSKAMPGLGSRPISTPQGICIHDFPQFSAIFVQFSLIFPKIKWTFMCSCFSRIFISWLCSIVASVTISCEVEGPGT